ncbi:hypothetical protein [Ochrobactrum sp. BTU1]|jgi:hypothetical protein|uniref:hypothetical protein n=1 Tax=Ochrobactrum sp. BTU1 TaxID=2840456 RepID=UPI001C04AF96|nr:hypothetical protein KMS41_18340 [Ochrobactrum sp. BTU1]
MVETVNALVKVRNTDKQAVDEFIRERFAAVFSKSTAKSKGENSVAYRGGSIVRPYGFKAVSTVQSSTDDAQIVKLWGRATMAPMAYAVLALIIGSILGLIADPVEYWFCGLLLAMLFVAMAKERKSTAKKIHQVLDEVKIRFS